MSPPCPIVTSSDTFGENIFLDYASMVRPVGLPGTTYLEEYLGRKIGLAWCVQLFIMVNQGWTVTPIP